MISISACKKITKKMEYIDRGDIQNPDKTIEDIVQGTQTLQFDCIPDDHKTRVLLVRFYGTVLLDDKAIYIKARATGASYTENIVQIPITTDTGLGHYFDFLIATNTTGFDLLDFPLQTGFPPEDLWNTAGIVIKGWWV